MAKKIDQVKEKREKNAEFALKYKPKKKDEEKKTSKQKRVAKYANWCRVRGHHPGCDLRVCNEAR
jgi:hypothetical protein